VVQFAVAVLRALVTAGLSEDAHREGYPHVLRYGFRLTLFVGVVCISVTGYLGASMIYGLHHYLW
jgi:hypothetical protein